MDTGIRLLVDLSNQECIGDSLNGPSLIQTLRSLSPEEAASTDTYEGYSAWSIALHVLYLKHMVSLELGAEVPEYDYEKTDFPKPPARVSREAWEKVIADNEAVHRGFVEALGKASPEKLASTFRAWKIPLGKAAAWVVSHDINHNGQIRNMGLESLRKTIG
jgi:hypothetical protein